MKRVCAVGLVLLAACGEIKNSDDGNEGGLRLSTWSSALTCQNGQTCSAGQHPAGFYCSMSSGVCGATCADGFSATATNCEPNTGLFFQSCVSSCALFGYTNGAADSNPICYSADINPNALIYDCAINLHQTQVLTLDQTDVSQPGQVNATVTLSNDVPSSMAWIQIDFTVTPNDGVDLTRSTDGHVQVPGTATIPTGSQTKSVPVTVSGVVGTDTVYTIHAHVNTLTNEQTAQLTYHAAPTVDSVSLSSTTVIGGQTVDGTVTLSAAAPAGGLDVTVTSNNPAVPSPSPFIVPIPGGQMTSATFHMPSATVTGNTAVTLSFATITQQSGGASPVTQSVTLTPAPPTSPLMTNPGCNANLLDRNDDESTDAVSLGTPLNFFGTTYDFAYVNNNGNVTFSAPLDVYTPFTIGATTPPIIAPFLADVDTRDPGSNVVRYGTTTVGGRPAFCVNWVDVGYFEKHSDKLNRFQLLLVDRGDIGTGDFDIYMNYDKLVWETGDFSGGTGGLGGTSAGAGFSAGNGDPNDFFQFPGSMVNGKFLDSNATSGLANTSHNSLQNGRHIFEVRNGAPPTGGGVITGLITTTLGAPLQRAPVQVCPSAGGQCVYVTRTGTDGRYLASGIGPGTYRVSAFPPQGSTLLSRTSGVVTMPTNPTAPVQVDLSLDSATGIPPGTSISPATVGAGGVPSVYWGNTLDLRTTGCAQGTATYEVVGSGGSIFASGPMTENPLGTYTAQIPPFYPDHGAATVNITLVCKDASVHTVGFNIYIDPSGLVRTVTGVPVPDATVTLLRSDTGLEFQVVEFGSDVMSPSNRRNPDLTDRQGHFGWDVISGFYKVRAERADCTSPTGGAYVESPVLTIPPAVIDLDLRLICPSLEDTTAPVSTASVAPAPNASGWNRGDTIVTITATDDRSGVKEIQYSLAGAQTGGATVAGAFAQAIITAEGITTVTYFARDNAGNQEASHTVTVRIDRTRPTITCSASPNVLWSPNHKLQQVEVAVSASDSLSGGAGFLLTSVTSSEPDNGLGDGDTTGDIQGWAVGTPDVSGFLRAERSGGGAGRDYTITYTARDVAGNTATCSTHVDVPPSSAAMAP